MYSLAQIVMDEKGRMSPLKKKKKILLMYPLSAYVSKPKKNANLET